MSRGNIQNQTTRLAFCGAKAVVSKAPDVIAAAYRGSQPEKISLNLGMDLTKKIQLPSGLRPLMA